MPPRQRAPLVFGEGLARETGTMATRPASMDDLRNVYHRKNKIVVRKGNVPKIKFVDENGAPMTVILGGHMLLGERTGVVVAYQGNAAEAAYGDVDIYLLDATATVQRRLGNWFNTVDIGLDPTEPPIVSITDMSNRAFFAHDEFRITKRAPTFAYDPFDGAELQALRINEGWPAFDENLDDDEQEEIRFRGVERYLEYLVGWGFGTSEKDRADTVRISLPGLPKTFLPEHYANVGARKDPTITCRPAGDVLAIFKEVETYRLVGFSRDNFGIEPLDKRFGCVASRLAVEVEGTCFFWSTHGPRMTNGGPSQNISHSLELDAAEPETLVDAAELLDGWANYIAEQRVVVFAFNRRLYVLSLHDVSQPRWSYWELGFDQFCGFQLYVTGVGTVTNSAPPGHPEWEREFSPNQFEGDTGEGPRSAKIAWDNVNQDGDERVEVWGRVVSNIVGDDWRMETDDDGDGVVDGFTKATSATTATFELDGSPLPVSQAIDVTASSGAGYARVQTVVDGIVAGDDYDFSVELFQESVGGGAHPELEIEWQQSDGTPISTETVDLDPPTSEHERRFVRDRTAPANAAQVEVRLKVATTAGGDVARVLFRLLEVSPVSSHKAWERLGVFSVATTTDQTETLTDLDPGAYYQTAVRYRRSVFFTAGYEGSDPAAWPDSSRGVTVATPGSEVTILSAKWKPRTGDEGQLQEYFDVRVETGDRFNLDLGLFVDDEAAIQNSNPIAVITPPHIAIETLEGLLGEGVAAATDQFYELTVSYLTDDGIRVGDGVSVSDVWPGPIEAPVNVFAQKTDSGEYTAVWEWGLLDEYLFGTPAIRIEENINGGGWQTADAGAGFITDQNQTEYVRATLNPGDSVEVRFSHEVTFGLQQFRSPYSPSTGSVPAFSV